MSLLAAQGRETQPYSWALTHMLQHGNNSSPGRSLPMMGNLSYGQNLIMEVMLPEALLAGLHSSHVEWEPAAGQSTEFRLLMLVVKLLLMVRIRVYYFVFVINTRSR